MSYPVTYYCPHCGTLVALEREGYLADKSVTPYPLEGWTYVAPTEPFDAEEGEGDAGNGGAVEADGVRFVCGESDGVDWDPHDGIRGTDVGGDEPYREPDAEGVGCGEAFYLSFVRFEGGREIDPEAAAEPVEINPDPRPSGPRGPPGPGEASGPGDSDGGFW